MLSSIELCAGGGGQALGLEQAGFQHVAALEIDPAACVTLRTNRPNWNVIEGDIHSFNGIEYRGIDLVAGGVPCPPFSIAGKQLGAADERDLFPEALGIIEEARPRAVMLENVRGLASARFEPYRYSILEKLADLGYQAEWRLMYSSDYGVPQLRPQLETRQEKRAGQTTGSSFEAACLHFLKKRLKDISDLPLDLAV